MIDRFKAHIVTLSARATIGPAKLIEISPRPRGVVVDVVVIVGGDDGIGGKSDRVERRRVASLVVLQR